MFPTAPSTPCLEEVFYDLPAASARVWVWARVRGLPNLNLRHPDAHQPALYDELAALSSEAGLPCLLICFLLRLVAGFSHLSFMFLFLCLCCSPTPTLADVPSPSQVACPLSCVGHRPAPAPAPRRAYNCERRAAHRGLCLCL